jgi:hypothetical protein
MPAPRGKLTDLPELAAYVLAHAAGTAWVFVVNPTIFRSLVASGYRDHIQFIAIALGIALAAVVLLIFLFLRKLMAGSGAAPPPADVSAPPVKFTDCREILAYVLAHAAAMVWNATATPEIFRYLIAQGHRNLMAPAFMLSIAVSIVVLLIFLFLRKAISGPAKPS